MLRLLRARFTRGSVAERDPRGGTSLRWLPVIRSPQALRQGICPTSALDPERPDRLDLGACVFCGACERAGVVEWRPGLPAPGATRIPLVAGATPEELPALRERLARLHGAFGRSLAVRHLDVGSCNGCDVEVHASMSPYFDPERFGVRFVASPRHADVLLLTGCVTRNLSEALVRTVEATPEPRAVVALGACGITGGIFAESPHVVGGAAKLVPVDVVVPGCPPPPESVLAGLVAAADILVRKGGARPQAPPAGPAAPP